MAAKAASGQSPQCLYYLNILLVVWLTHDFNGVNWRIHTTRNDRMRQKKGRPNGRPNNEKTIKRLICRRFSGG